ncbi:type II secretion system F family protein [Hyphomonas johnsonii]|jgi:tight adherence protein C|uniref:Putative Flp pilus assembly protein TadC n=1 Tax=Hyphomonas johnsonii MHS-2 TaxID=1280950 RepID=A0A059FTX3_9PROT|nr:type II secretion system F family protein [Hyphomonas johnsonii]KCZ93961.1 putative Flp pilus assembly protein TadC [Hyphomonas johnsonii MHS-2]
MDISFLSGAWAPLLMLAAATVLAVPSLLSFLRGRRESEQVERRLERRRTPREEAEGNSRNESRIGKAVTGLTDQATPDDAESVSVARAKLIAAGFSNPTAVGRYYFARLVCVVIPQIGLFFALPYMAELPWYAPLASSIGLVLVGLGAPAFFLDRRINGRRQECSGGFPDMMDLLVACVEAGLSLDASVQRVGEELELRHPIIAGHMRTLSLELRAGRARKTAWRGFADRLGIEEAGSLATMLRQAEEMGTSLGQTLRVFSADMRQRRILYAEEKAMALPAKLTLPLIFFVFPVLLGVLVMPTVVMFREIF